MSSSIREDLDDFFRYCDRLLTSARMPGVARFSHEDLKRLCFYSNEVAKLVDSQQRLDKRRSGNPDAYRLDYEERANTVHTSERTTVRP
jgi:hypothetical protein